MTQIDDLRRQWQALDERLTRSTDLQAELVRRVIMQPARRRVGRLAIWPVLDILACIACLLPCVVHVVNMWPRWNIVAPACVIIAGALALLIDSLRQLARVIEVDWTGPVASIQRSLERLRMARIRQFKWIILLSPLVGFCGFMAGLHWLSARATGNPHSIAQKLHPAWVIGNYLFAVLFVPLAYWAAGLLRARCHTHPWWQSVLDDISGKTLKSAASDIEQWAALQAV